MDGAEGQEAVGRNAAITCDPVVHVGRETHNVGAHVIDEPGALHAELIEEDKESLRIGGVAFDFREVPAAALHELELNRFHHVQGHDVDVNVDDRLHEEIVPSHIRIYVWRCCSLLQELLESIFVVAKNNLGSFDNDRPAN
jgi:hypothetical protein